MSEQTWSNEQLQVIGYMDRVTPDSVPRLLRAVFEVKGQPGVLVLPPYRWDQRGHLAGGCIENRSSFTEMVEEGDAAWLSNPIDALTGQLLWVDMELTVHYSPPQKVRLYLQETSKEFIRRARAALRDGQLRRALELSQVALTADERSINALVAAATAHRRLGNEAGLAILRSVARSIVPTLDLDDLIATDDHENLAGIIATPSTANNLFEQEDLPMDPVAARQVPCFAQAA